MKLAVQFPDSLRRTLLSALNVLDGGPRVGADRYLAGRGNHDGGRTPVAVPKGSIGTARTHGDGLAGDVLSAKCPWSNQEKHQNYGYF